MRKLTLPIRQSKEEYTRHMPAFDNHLIIRTLEITDYTKNSLLNIPRFHNNAQQTQVKIFNITELKSNNKS